MAFRSAIGNYVHKSAPKFVREDGVPFNVLSMEGHDVDDEVFLLFISHPPFSSFFFFFFFFCFYLIILCES